MALLYPSWVEIPAHDLDRALAFYRAVFNLEDTPFYDAADAQIVVLLESDKDARAPGVSLVKSPLHTPSEGGATVNFHVGTHTALAEAITTALAHGGTVKADVVDEGDGQRCVTLIDSEGNTIAISSYEPNE
jgi:hypothetical protein